MKKLSREQYLVWYTNTQGLTLESFNSLYSIQPCKCGRGDCKGWQAIQNDRLSILAWIESKFKPN